MVENLEDALVSEAILRKTHMALDGEQVGIRGPDGKSYRVPSENLYKALNTPGVSYESPDMLDTRKFAEGPFGEVSAFAAGTARSLSFGGSDLLLRALGGADTARALREENPWSSITGEGLGIAGPLLIGGPIGAINAAGTITRSAGAVGRFGLEASSAVRAARTVGILPRFAAGAGLKVGRAAQKGLYKRGYLAGGVREAAAVEGARAAKGLERLMDPFVRDTNVKRFFVNRFSQGIAAAVEGGIYGAGMLVTDAALSDEPLDLEKVLGTLGGTFALGGVLGTAIGSGTLRSMQKRGPLASKSYRRIEGILPGQDPRIYAVKAVMDLSDDSLQGLVNKYQKLHNAGFDGELPAGQLSIADALGEVGNILSDEKLWLKVRSFFASQPDDGLKAASHAVRPPVEALFTPGVLPRMKSPQEMRDAVSDLYTYLVHRLDVVPDAADALPLVREEIGKYEQIYENQKAAHKADVADFERARMSVEEDIAGEMVEDGIKYRELTNYEGRVEQLYNHKKSILNTLAAAGDDIYNVDTAGFIKAFEEMRGVLTPAQWEDLGFTLLNGNLHPMVAGAPDTNIMLNTGDALVEYLRNDRQIPKSLKTRANAAKTAADKAAKEKMKKLVAGLGFKLYARKKTVSAMIEPLMDESADLGVLIARDAQMAEGLGTMGISDQMAEAAASRVVKNTLKKKKIDAAIRKIRSEAAPKIREWMDKAMHAKAASLGGVEELFGVSPIGGLPFGPASDISPAGIVKKSLALLEGTEGTSLQRSVRAVKAELRAGTARARNLERQLSKMEMPELKHEIDEVPRYLIDKTAVAKRLLGLADDIKGGYTRGVVGDTTARKVEKIFEGVTTDVEEEIIKMLEEQAKRLNSLPVARFVEANQLRRLMDAHILYRADGTVNLSVGGQQALSITRREIKKEIEEKLYRSFRDNLVEEIDGVEMMYRELIPVVGDRRTKAVKAAEAAYDAQMGANQIIDSKAKGMVNEWANDNLLFGVVADLEKGANKKVRNAIAEKLKLHNPWLFGTLLSVAIPGGLTSHALTYVTGALGMYFFNTFGEQLMAAARKSLSQRRAFLKSISATQGSMDEAIDSLFSPKKLAFKTYRYSAYLAARPDIEDE